VTIIDIMAKRHWPGRRTEGFHDAQNGIRHLHRECSIDRAARRP